MPALRSVAEVTVIILGAIYAYGAMLKATQLDGADLRVGDTLPLVPIEHAHGTTSTPADVGRHLQIQTARAPACLRPTTPTSPGRPAKSAQRAETEDPAGSAQALMCVPAEDWPLSPVES
jgi:hypothetical protein